MHSTNARGTYKEVVFLGVVSKFKFRDLKLPSGLTSVPTLLQATLCACSIQYLCFSPAQSIFLASVACVDTPLVAVTDAGQQYAPGCPQYSSSFCGSAVLPLWVVPPPKVHNYQAMTHLRLQSQTLNFYVSNPQRIPFSVLKQPLKNQYVPKKMTVAFLFGMSWRYRTVKR